MKLFNKKGWTKQKVKKYTTKLFDKGKKLPIMQRCEQCGDKVWSERKRKYCNRCTNGTRTYARYRDGADYGK